MKTCYNPVAKRLHHTESLQAQTQPEKTGNILQPYQEGSQLFDYRAVIKRCGPGISPATMNVAPGDFHRKIEEK